MGPVRFRDRAEAGRRLADALGHLRGAEHLVVLGLPRGGVAVAAEVAAGLSAPLDVLVVRKLGFPGHDELAIGAVASGGALVLNDEVLAMAGLDHAGLEERAAWGRQDLADLERRLRGDRPPLSLDGTTAVLVDDGLATGATMRVAAVAARQAGATRVVVAAPVGSREAVQALNGLADEVVCLVVPANLRAVGVHYRDFSPVGEVEVRRLLGWADE
jgi:putative phosphoribosyl transferase